MKRPKGYFYPLFQWYAEVSAHYPREVLSFLSILITTIIGGYYLRDSNSSEIAGYFLRITSIFWSFYQLKTLKTMPNTLSFAIGSFLFSAGISWIILEKIEDTKRLSLWPILLLLDSSKIKNIYYFITSGKTKEEMLENVPQGFTLLLPRITLDIFLRILVISIGILGPNYLKTFSLLACLAILIDYVIFILLFPAYLAILISKKKITYKKNIEDFESPNLVLKNIKLIMCICITSMHCFTCIKKNYFHNNKNYETLSILILTATVLKLLDWINKTKEHQTTKNKIQEIIAISKETLSDDERILKLVYEKKIPMYSLEKILKDYERAIRLRRTLLGITKNLPYKNYEYEKIFGTCCENVIGYMTIPVGVAGPLLLDGKLIQIPMATTEGCLVASTNRACRALRSCGVSSFIISDGMTRGPVVKFPALKQASEALQWIKIEENFKQLKQEFDSTSNYAKLQQIKPQLAGRILFLRFVATTGDAMGMNMLTKGTEISLKFLQMQFPQMEIISVSGNYCNDKKPAAINWIEGRGKSVTCNALVPHETIHQILKTASKKMVNVNYHKNLLGSAIAGSIGGFNAHAANIVAAIFIATGQDPAQTVTSSNCLTIMETQEEGLYVSCTMPSIEVGTVGGGTILKAQSACLELMGVKGSGELPGENANNLARIVCAAVLAGELSLIAAQAEGQLGQSHLRYNRKNSPIL